jgi:hypothetical protein
MHLMGAYLAGVCLMGRRPHGCASHRRAPHRRVSHAHEIKRQERHRSGGVIIKAHLRLGAMISRTVMGRVGYI